MSDVTALLNRINDLDRSSLKVLNGSFANSDRLVHLTTVLDNYMSMSFNIIYTSSTFTQNAVFRVVKSGSSDLSVAIIYNEFDTQIIDDIISYGGSLYISVPDAYKIGDLTVSTILDITSTTVLNITTSNITTKPTPTIDTILDQNIVFGYGDDLRLYKNQDGDIVLDALENRLKVKGKVGAGLYEEIYVTGDSTYGVSSSIIKENIADADYHIIDEFFRTMDLRTFNYTKDYDPEMKEDISFIIEELPESNIKDTLIHYSKTGIDKYSLNTMVMLLAGGLKTQIERNDNLEKLISELSNHQSSQNVEFAVRLSHLEDLVGVAIESNLDINPEPEIPDDFLMQVRSILGLK